MVEKVLVCLKTHKSRKENLVLQKQQMEESFSTNRIFATLYHFTALVPLLFGLLDLHPLVALIEGLPLSLVIC